MTSKTISDVTRVGRAGWLSGLALAAGLTLSSAAAWSAELEKVTFRTNWFPQAEHGGWYHADSQGTYEDFGLDVDMEPGGPQVNNIQLLLGGRADFVMLHSSGQILTALEEGLPLVALAAFYQKDPQIIMSHPGVGNDSLEDLKGKPILLSQDAHQSFWPWLKQKYGYTDDQVRPYTFQMGPFIADPEVIQQAYVTSETFVVKEAGIDPNVFLLSDHGWRSYSTMIVTTRETLEERPEVARKFVEATIEGWYQYLQDPQATNEYINELNENQTPEQLAHSLREMDERGIVLSGDALTDGIGIMTDERWQAIHEQLVGLGLVDDSVDPTQGYTTEFVGTEAIHDIMARYPDVSGVEAD
ncbi:ABC transporter substrate-binding protein [Marinobacter sp. OP 3.4]|uniref:ABC transporter substrate-binding protein n=1 Tax=Marinobacter sp. OP 3.4 TaxID=3076501 RepID=UPI002E1FA5E2